MAENSEFSLLIKLLGMTGSSHDGEALAASRKANAQLAKLGWTWEKLLLSRVTVVADPFAAAPSVAGGNHAKPQAPSPQRTTPQPQPPPSPFQARPRPQPQPKAAPQPQPNRPQYARKPQQKSFVQQRQNAGKTTGLSIDDLI